MDAGAIVIEYLAGKTWRECALITVRMDNGALQRIVSCRFDES